MLVYEVFRVRREGRLVPRHLMWADRTVGTFFLQEQREVEVNRTLRVATICNEANKPLLPELYDATVLSAKPDWMSVTGWERIVQGTFAHPTAFAQTWVMIPLQSGAEFEAFVRHAGG